MTVIETQLFFSQKIPKSRGTNYVTTNLTVLTVLATLF